MVNGSERCMQTNMKRFKNKFVELKLDHKKLLIKFN